MQHEEFAVSGDKPHLSPNTQQDPCGISVVCGDKCHLSPQKCPGSNESSGIRGDNSRLSPLRSEIRKQITEKWSVIVVIYHAPSVVKASLFTIRADIRAFAVEVKKEPVLVAVSCGTKAESARRP